jgi:phosphoglucan,water dikinase
MIDTCLGSVDRLGAMRLVLNQSTGFRVSARRCIAPNGLQMKLFPNSTKNLVRAVPSMASAATQQSRVTFRVKKAVDFGEHVRLVGNHSSLGRWSSKKSKAEMSWTDGDVWEVTLPLEEFGSKALEFKCVVVKSDGEVVWEDGENHLVDWTSQGQNGLATVTISWGASVDVDVDVDEVEGQTSSEEDSGNEDVVTSISFDDDKPELEQWSGDNIVFMQSNEHPRERQGVWNTDGLQGVALKLVEGDRDAGSWLSKLELVKNVIVDRECNMRPPIETLAHSFIYLTWVSNGSIKCVESGGHHRPNHHARLSQLMFRSLEWIIGERQGTADALFARRMQTRIPSFTDEFMQSTPLTRIRDIAHRNDIPQDLKREIKHTIQNKLHRNAGPEDLAASEALLRRIMENESDYSQDFVKELQVFLKELRDFFNAGSLEDALKDLSPSLDEDSCRLIDNFILAKKKVDSMASWNDNTVMDCMHALTTVRALLSRGLGGGLRNDAPEKALSMRQKWRLAEIRAEDYIFMMLSRFINNLEDKGGYAFLQDANDGSWALPIGALVLSIRHIGLTGYQQSECMALENELMAWQQTGGFAHEEESRRFSATLNRVMRLTEAFCGVVVESLFAPSMSLGSALGVDDAKASVFAESEIRSNIAFQTSKIASLLLKSSKKAANMPPWQIICQGDFSGRLVMLDELSPHSISQLENMDENFIAVVKNASGDEELVSLTQNLQGVVLLHDIPHLSHLGVRARQENLPFIASDDLHVHQDIVSHIGDKVTISAGSNGVTVTPGVENVVNPLDQKLGKAEAQPIKPVLVSTPCVIPLLEADVETCGSKAFACKELQVLSNECVNISSATNGTNGSGAVFHSLPGLVIPFGCLESVISQNGQSDTWKDLLQKVQDASTANPQAMDDVCQQVQEFILCQKLPRTLSVMIGSSLSDHPMLILRSSANVEDLKGLSGAGLYDSITNIPTEDHDSIETGVKQVWASLFSRRAIMARAAVGILPEDAHMAVLIQPQLAPNLSFVLHTQHPLVDGALLAEIAPGQGEILASGTRGSGWRLTVDPQSVSCDAFANFSNVLLPEKPQGKLAPKTMDYSRHELSCSQESREVLGKRLAVVGKLLEKVFECPQDVEGCLSDDIIYVLQTRPQP